MISRRRIKFCAWTVAVTAAVVYLAAAFRVPSDVDITHAFHATTIPHLDLREVPLDQAIATVLGHVRTQNPRLGHISFHIYYFDPSKPPVTITLLLDDISADKAMLYIVNLSSMNWKPRAGTVYLYPLTGDGGSPPLTRSDHLALELQLLRGRVRALFQ